MAVSASPERPTWLTPRPLQDVGAIIEAYERGKAASTSGAAGQSSTAPPLVAGSPQLGQPSLQPFSPVHAPQAGGPAFPNLSTPIGGDSSLLGVDASATLSSLMSSNAQLQARLADAERVARKAQRRERKHAESMRRMAEQGSETGSQASMAAKIDELEAQLSVLTARTARGRRSRPTSRLGPTRGAPPSGSPYSESGLQTSRRLMSASMPALASPYAAPARTSRTARTPRADR